MWKNGKLSMWSFWIYFFPEIWPILMIKHEAFHPPVYQILSKPILWHAKHKIWSGYI
jgi:hypothetical protein